MTNQTIARTRVIAGQVVTLEEGAWYWASRPFISRSRKIYPIWIHDEAYQVVLTIGGLSLKQANDFLDEFNDKDFSFNGRFW